LLSNRSKATHLRLVSLALDARLEDQPQLVEIGGGELVEEVAVCHPGVGHSWISLKVEHSKENPAVAFGDERHPGEPRASSVGHLPYTPVAGSLPCRRNIRWVVAFNARISIIGIVKA
jgi:hypothetical protein